MHFRRTVTTKDNAFPSQDLALPFGVSNVGAHTFTNEFSFKLGNGCQDMQQKPCRGILMIRVDALGYCEEPNTVRIKCSYSARFAKVLHHIVRDFELRHVET